MGDIEKPIIVISKCLGFDHCRYDGSIVENDFIERLKKYINVISICPEVQCGLTIPRNSLRIVEVNGNKELMQPKDEKNLTEEMEKISKEFIDSLKSVDGFILKCKSPSCGVRDAKIYSSIEKGCALKRGKGIFAEIASEKFPYIPIEDEGRLTNFKIREHFLTRIFILADYRKAKENFCFKKLRSFHLKNTLLFLSYSQKYSKILDSLIYNNFDDENTLFKEYEFNLYRLLERAPRYTSNINVLLKSLEQFKDNISQDEIQFIWNTIDKYKKGMVPFSVPLYLVKGYVIRFELHNLMDQSFFMPYPEELILVNDSGKLIH